MAERKSKSRSEKIRAKRTSNGKRAPARKGRKTQPVAQSMPPVLMRRGFSNMTRSKQKKKGKTPRRRFDIALSAPGVEMSLPAVPSVRIGWRLLSAVLAVSLLVLFYHLWTSPIYQIQEAELEGNTYLDRENINQVLNLYNKPIFMIDPQEIEANLQRSYQSILLDSSVQIIWPATVVVTVQERQPIIAWEQGGEINWVDAEGISFKPAGENKELVKVTGESSPPSPIVIEDSQTESEPALDPLEAFPAPEAFMTPQMAAAIVTMDEYVPNMSSLTYNSQHGLGWHDKKRGWDVYFGVDVSKIQEKLAAYKAIKSQLKADGITPVLISVEHVHAPYYRLEP